MIYNSSTLSRRKETVAKPWRAGWDTTLSALVPAAPLIWSVSEIIEMQSQDRFLFFNQVLTPSQKACSEFSDNEYSMNTGHRCHSEVTAAWAHIALGFSESETNIPLTILILHDL